jgi:V-type H+-transporting ATPase subunit a
MKMSVILGVSQMLVGIILKWFNMLHFEKYGQFCAVCIPELLFMTCTFGYMCFLIFLKWTTDYSQGQFQHGVPCYESCSGDPITGKWASEYASDGGCYREPPMIITTLIGMFMSVGAVGQDQTNGWDKCKFYLFESQEGLQTFFLMIALICIPWLFAVQPVLVYKAHEKEVADRQVRGGMAHTSEDSASDGESDEPEDDGFNMGDVIVGQAIHAIEFILGAVSNTASYLRLWALSLAHSQLSEVFWEYIFKGYEIELLGGQYPGLASNSVPFIIVCYALFFCCTIAVLMVMESLSAFLHALRLQWVEFQNKFYSATGYKFHPLDFDDTDMPFDMEN